MDVSNGTNGSHALAERVYRRCGMGWISGFADICHAYFTGWAENIQEYFRTRKNKYIFSSGFNVMPLCYNRMGSIVVYVGTDMGQIINIAI